MQTVPTKDLAIQKALENKWEDAFSLNQVLLEENPNDLDTLNRLAFSLIKLGRLVDAQKTYEKVIAIDKTNPIALKNLKKIDSISKQNLASTSSQPINNVRVDELFIEEAGKTKIVELKNVADKITLSYLQPGDEVYLVIKRSKIFAQTSNKKYVGMLPDNISTRLIPFMRAGNEYQSYIKSIDDKNVMIFIKESKKSKKLQYQPSFTYLSPTVKKG